MAADIERLRVWMLANGHDAKSLQRALGWRFSLEYAIGGSRHMGNGVICQFRDTFGEATFIKIFGPDVDGRLAKYAAQLAVYRAVVKGQLPRVTTLKCHGCDNQAQAYHHESYDPANRLAVVPLCDTCHRRHHTGKKRLTFGVVPTAVGLVRIASAREPA